MENYSKGQMVAIGAVFGVMPVVAVGVRLWAKSISRKGIRLDDYLIVGALAFAIACCILQLIAAIDGRLGQHQIIGADGQPILQEPSFLIFERCKFALQMLATIGLGLTKASVLVFFRSIFSIRKFKIWADIVLVMVGAWTISFFFSNLFACNPITALVKEFHGNDCIDVLPMWLASCITDFIIDFVILALPIPMVLKLQVHWHQKLAIQMIFLLGTSVCAISVTRFYMYWNVGQGYLEHYNDNTYYTSPVYFWTNIEIAVGVITACTPTYRPVYLHWKRKPTTAMQPSKSRSTSVFGFPHFRGVRLHGRDSLSEGDNARLKHDASVSTMIESGNPSTGDRLELDLNSISVRHDIHTNSDMPSLDRIA